MKAEDVTDTLELALQASGDRLHLSEGDRLGLISICQRSFQAMM